MKYFTKEWYELSQKVSAHLLLEEDREAENFSEEYFARLYNQKLQEWLDLHREAAEITVEIIDAKGNRVSVNKDNKEVFAPEKAAREFHESFLINQECIRKILPQEILDQIADIRVFVLNRASSKVKAAVTEFCENNLRLVNKTIEEYRTYYKEASKTLDKHILDKLSFHDFRVAVIEQTDLEFSIIFEADSLGVTNKVTFKDYEILKRDSDLVRSWWLYQELYKTGDKYELHVLFVNEGNEPEELIIVFESVVFD